MNNDQPSDLPPGSITSNDSPVRREAANPLPWLIRSLVRKQLEACKPLDGEVSSQLEFAPQQCTRPQKNQPPTTPG